MRVAFKLEKPGIRGGELRVLAVFPDDRSELKSVSRDGGVEAIPVVGCRGGGYPFRQFASEEYVDTLPDARPGEYAPEALRLAAAGAECEVVRWRDVR